LLLLDALLVSMLLAILLKECRDATFIAVSSRRAWSRHYRTLITSLLIYYVLLLVGEELLYKFTLHFLILLDSLLLLLLLLRADRLVGLTAPAHVVAQTLDRYVLHIVSRGGRLLRVNDSADWDLADRCSFDYAC